MDKLYLILHKVRGKPAFDIAQCHPGGVDGWPETDDPSGVWWIIPTSGHRAFPAIAWLLDAIDDEGVRASMICAIHYPQEETDNPKWKALPDHYSISRPAPTKLSLADLGLATSPAETLKINRPERKL